MKPARVDGESLRHPLWPYLLFKAVPVSAPPGCRTVPLCRCQVSFSRKAASRNLSKNDKNRLTNDNDRGILFHVGRDAA